MNPERIEEIGRGFEQAARLLAEDGPDLLDDLITSRRQRDALEAALLDARARADAREAELLDARAREDAVWAVLAEFRGTRDGGEALIVKRLETALGHRKAVTP